MKFLYIFVFILLISSCQINNSSENETKDKSETSKEEINKENESEISDEQENEKKETLTYSNINNEEVRQEVKWLLETWWIEEKNIDEFLDAVNKYNKDIENISLTTAWYKQIDWLEVKYDEVKIIDLYDKVSFPFIWMNCRLTSYKLLKDFINIENPDITEARNLFIDNDAIKNAKKWFFSENESKELNTFFWEIETERTKDISLHLKNVKEYFKEKWITFKQNPNMSFINVFFHNTLDDVLFIGHAGLLLPYKENKIAFIEKLAFQLPYQIVIFNNRLELNDYLMRKYDISYNQPEEARPFIMENSELLEWYRANIKNPWIR